MALSVTRSRGMLVLAIYLIRHRPGRSAAACGAARGDCGARARCRHSDSHRALTRFVCLARRPSKRLTAWGVKAIGPSGHLPVGAALARRANARPSPDGTAARPALRLSPRPSRLAPGGFQLFEFVERPGPVAAHQARERSVREQAPARLACRAVVALVIGVGDALHGRAASRARPPEPAVDRHAVPERRHLVGERVASLRPKPLDPATERVHRRAVQAFEPPPHRDGASAAGARVAPRAGSRRNTHCRFR